MDSKWMCLVCFITTLLFLNCAYAQDDDSDELPASCPRPENAVTIRLPQLFGKWHYQAMVVDDGPNNDVMCSRIEFVRTGKRRAFVSGSQYYKSTGNASYSYGTVRVLRSEVIVTDSIDIPNTQFYSYPLLVNSDALVYYTCVIRNGRLLDSTNVAVLTRKVSVDRKYVQDLLTQAKVKNTNDNVSYADNFDECFTLTCHRRST